MEENSNTKLLNENEAHVNVLIRREQEINKKLVHTELLMSRYKVIHNIGLFLLGTSNISEAKNKFIDNLSSSLMFQKIALLRVAQNVEVVGQSGYGDDAAKALFEKIDVSEYLLTIFKSNASYEAVYLDADKISESLLGLSTFLVGRIITADYRLYIIAGYDSSEGEAYRYRYPLSKEDTSWFVQLVLLWNSFLERVRLFEQLNSKIKENNLLIEEKEKQVEDRTRTLLEALFDAKKYKLALELADIMVVLIDAASHKIIYANEQFEHISGYRRELIVSRKTLEYFGIIPLSGTVDFFSDDFNNILKNGKSVKGMYVVRVEGGGEKQLDLSTSRLEEDEGGSIYVIIGRDVTSERSIQKREKEYAENIEKLNRLIVNRELRIIELKRKVIQNI